MKLRITPAILNDFPRLLLGVIIAKNIDNKRQISAIKQLIRGAAASQKKELQEKPERESLIIWKAIQKYPARIEEVLQGVKNGKLPATGTPLEDVMLYYSIKNELPIRAEDLDEVSGDIELTYANSAEPFRRKGSTKLEHPDANEIIYKDKAGATCRFFNAVECERTALMNTTKNIAIIIENLGLHSNEKMKEILKEMAASIQKYCHGTIEIHLLGDRVSEVDLGITGKAGISENDFRPNPKRLEFHQRVLAQQGFTQTQKVFMQEQKNTLQEATTATTVNATKKTATTTKTHEKKRTPLVRENLQEVIAEAVQKTFPHLTELPAYMIDHPKDEMHGEYACNIALVLTKALKQSPKEIAEAILQHLQKPQYLEHVEYAPPGFINFFLAEKWLRHEIPKIVSNESPYDHCTFGQRKKIIVEYSQPNIAKPLGVHHLLSTIIGQTVYNLYTFLGYETISINHIGDWGTQFGKLIVAYQKWGNKKKIEKDPINELLALYVRFHEEAEKDKTMEEDARAVFKKLEDGDEEIQKLWKWCVNVSMQDVEKTYDALGGIHFDYTQGESFYSDKMRPIIEEGLRRKIFIPGEEGALIVQFKNDKLSPLLVQKSDGASLYATRDLAQIQYRIKTWHPEKILYVVDVAQSLHFQQLFETMKSFGTHDTKLIHVSFGRMRFADKKMSTREGNIIVLNSVLQEAVERAKKLIETKKGTPKKVIGQLAISVGMGALKYNILSQNRMTDIVFDWDRMLSLEGNSAPYLQYSYARCHSILHKSETVRERKKIDKLADQTNLFDTIEEKKNGEENELKILKKLIQFPEALLRTAEEYKPNILCQYLYELAQTFNAFYHTTPVLQAESTKLREERLELVKAVGETLKKGLHILGIEAPERM